MQETQCPQCGEWLGVPPEFADRPVRCGACGRVIQPGERASTGFPPPPPPPPPPDRGRPRFPDDDAPRSARPRFPDRDDDSDPSPPRKGGGLWWLWLLLAFGGLSLCCCGGGVALVAQAGRWKAYTPDNKAFTADFPGKPNYETKPFQWKDEKQGTSHEYVAVQPFDTQAFAVHYVDLPKSLKGVSPDALLKYGLEDFKRNSTNFTVLTSDEVTVKDKYKALDVEGTTTDPKAGLLHVSVRVVIVGDRVFTLIAGGKDRKKLTRDKERFFRSFEPADPTGDGGEKPTGAKEK